MINHFIKYLPTKLAGDIHKQYEGYLPIFNSYMGSESHYYDSLNSNTSFAHFMLALALFYSSVIVPLREARSCFKDFSDRNIKAIRIGQHTLSKSSTISIERMYLEFNGILRRHGITDKFLLFSDVRDFARSLNIYLKTKQHE